MSVGRRRGAWACARTDQLGAASKRPCSGLGIEQGPPAPGPPPPCPHALCVYASSSIPLPHCLGHAPAATTLHAPVAWACAALRLATMPALWLPTSRSVDMCRRFCCRCVPPFLCGLDPVGWLRNAELRSLCWLRRGNAWEAPRLVSTPALRRWDVHLPPSMTTKLSAAPQTCCPQAVAINPRMSALRQHIMQLRELLTEEQRQLDHE